MASSTGASAGGWERGENEGPQTSDLDASPPQAMEQIKEGTLLKT